MQSKTHFWLRVFILVVVKSGFVSSQAPPARTAKVETTEIKSMGNGGKGALRMGMEAVVAQCNGLREAAHLPPRYPPPEMLEQLDVVDHVYVYDGRQHRALNMATAHLMRLDDEERWVKEGGTGPPPDCSVATAFTDRSATLWRDGKRYELDYIRKTAVQQSPRAGDTVPQNLPPRPVAGVQEKTIAGQMCSMQSAPSVSPMIAVPDQCLWKGFDTIGYLNLPLALSRTNRIGAGAGLMGREMAKSAVADAPLEQGLFEIPADFKVIERSSVRR